MRKLLACVLLCALPAAAAAQRDDGDDDETWDDGQPEEAPGGQGTLDRRIQELEARVADAERRAARPLPVRLSGYVDLGFFAPIGNAGQGVRRDVAHAAYPEHRDVDWVFYGDLLATQVNSRGEAADLGELPGVDRFDSIDSNGDPTFLVNEVNLSVAAALGSKVLVSSSVNLTPRRGRDFALGDWLDVDLAQLEWMPSDQLSIFVGKLDSVLGHEYKTRKAGQRFGITPTLVQRYTAGTAIGLKARALLAGDHLRVAAAVTNGSFGTEQFHFHDEMEANAGKTVSGRLATRLRLGAATLELAVSGQAGAQDGAPDGAGTMWLVGPDLELTTVGFALRAQWLKGHAPGDEMARAYALELHSAGYVEATWLAAHWLGLLCRGELRDADVSLGAERLYITRSWRAVAGVRLVLSPSTTLKMEYLHNGEYDGVPQFEDDVFTTSLVAVY